MTYNLVRGWAPLRGVIVGNGQVHRPAHPGAVRPGGRSGEAEATSPISERDRREVMDQPAARLRCRAAAAPGAGIGVGARGAAVARLRHRAARRPKDRYTEADDPKTLVEVDRDLHRASEALRAGRARRRHPPARQRHRETSRHGRRLHSPGAHLLGVRRARPRDRHARAGAAQRRARPRSARPARRLSRRERRRSRARHRRPPGTARQTTPRR